MIITIDGPAGSGKSTAAKELAKALGLAYLDTGAMYRAVTLAALRENVDLQDADALTALAERVDLRLERRGDGAHYVARAAGVRRVLVSMQRRLGAELAATAGGVVAEGRDQGSVVFPDADVKFYLDAAPEVRARRRFEEMRADGQQVTYRAVLEALVQRDGRDRNRAVAPLVKPDGAVELDTSEMTVEDVTAELKRRVEQAQ